MVRELRLLFLVLSVFSFGCTHRRSVAGHDIDPKIVQQEIVPGTTTKREVTERFGKPDHINQQPGGNEEYLYTYRGVVEKTTELFVYAKKETGNERKNLRILFNGDVVKEVSYTNSFAPEENFSK